MTTANGEVVMIKRLPGGKIFNVRSRTTSADESPQASEISGLLASIHIEMWSIDQPRPHARQTRKHSPKQISQLASSIHKFGFVVPMIVDDQGTILAGHARLSAARLLELTKVPVIRIDHLSDSDKRLFALAENRLAEISDWDEDVLALELEELTALDLELDLDVTGFDTADIDRILDSARRAADDPADDLPIIDAPAVSRFGDLWFLRNHRLLCGNALHRDTYIRLLGNAKAQMVFTDPPYNCKIAGHARDRASGHREFQMASGEMSPFEFKAFLAEFLNHTAAFAEDGAIVYVCMDQAHMMELLAAAGQLFDKPKNVCVWVKNNAGMGSFYRSQHELIFVFKNGDAPHINNFGLGDKGRYRTNVWEYPSANSPGAQRAATLAMHPTVKPCALVIDAIKDCSHRNGIVLDPFVGSGTTILACERTGRRAYSAELDPLYVDLAIRRWQQLTGDIAIHAETKLPFEAVAGRYRETQDER
jgi:DNA modification methylase